ncbi:MAG: glycoside hydrolase family 97 protein, partial [Acidobacteria bacterium]|nr:glycoside hydrolase family 97 protein [Acidobacteriota bacterium]
MKTINRMVYCLLFSMLFIPAGIAQEQSFRLESPDGKLKIDINPEEEVQWSLRYEDDAVIERSSISMAIENGKVLGENSRLLESERKSVDAIIPSPLYKKSEVVDRYNELTLRFAGSFSLIFRAYNDGAAYRFATSMPGDIHVAWEECNFNLAENHRIIAPYLESHEEDIYASSFESLYQFVRIADFDMEKLSYTPVIIDLGNGKKAAIMEIDLEDYPGLFLKLNRETRRGFVSEFARYPLEEKQGGHNNLQAFVTKRADYIARTRGSRMFPWRVLVVSTEDRQLAGNDMVYRLASPTRIDTSWIKPGKLAWDWWNDWNISRVDFPAGINNPTYRHYIDFASANGIEYILLDEGWSESTDLMKPIPEIDLEELVAYADRRNVGIILWAGWLPLNRRMDEVMSHYAAMGIKGFKVDFMDRNDQEMVRFYYRTAETAARYKLLIDYHGAYTPTGWVRTWPNIITSEGVRGLEYQKWEQVDAPRHNVSIPFIRMLAGPMDFTPGAMKNAGRQNFRPIFSAPMSQGTRCHQLAMYVVYESPLSMLADNPTQYLREQESVDFITAIPTVFDQTVALEGKIGEYAAIARRKGANWYAGAMTNWDPREMELDFSFLPEGKYEALIFEDGINAHREG